MKRNNWTIKDAVRENVKLPLVGFIKKRYDTTGWNRYDALIGIANTPKHEIHNRLRTDIRIDAFKNGYRETNPYEGLPSIVFTFSSKKG